MEEKQCLVCKNSCCECGRCNLTGDQRRAGEFLYGHDGKLIRCSFFKRREDVQNDTKNVPRLQDKQDVPKE